MGPLLAHRNLKQALSEPILRGSLYPLINSHICSLLRNGHKYLGVFQSFFQLRTGKTNLIIYFCHQISDACRFTVAFHLLALFILLW